MHKWGLAAALRPNGTPPAVPSPREATLPQDALEWSWPPYAPVETDDESFDTEEWAPSSVVSHPRLRVGRWTLLYRRSA
ncbi:hypothetical protein [Modestobacter excelsi]|uniref:hypothetical protein n=1 Tax=Modestobacter excelsi TaxID=2213161 RepID=UPI00110CE078|nr:hypothetical protein [Modestobacter excelsi]